MARRPLPLRATLALAGLILPTGCGGQAAALQPGLVSVRVVRASSIPQNHTAPFERTVTDTASVGRLYALLAGLPVFPQGVLHCPADFGVQYQLTFSGNTASSVKATVDAAGCGRVTVGKQERWWATVPTFWQQFADDLGVPEAAVYPVTLQS